MNFNKYKYIKKSLDVLIFKNKIKVKSLNYRKKKSLGRIRKKGIVLRHRGGGNKKNYRLLAKITKKQSAIILTIEYDPNRSGFISLVKNHLGIFFYILTPSKSKIGDLILINPNIKNLKIKKDIKRGQCLPLKYIPRDVPIFNIEKYPGSGFIYSKSAGVFSKILSKNKHFITIELPSKEKKIFHENCLAFIGQVSNKYSYLHKKYKAGNNRHLNRRPKVRGVAMNPVDHPHGGGEGKTSGGRISVSPWGKLTKGVPTAKKNRKYI